MIREQLRNYCDCIKDDIPDEDIQELVNLISMYTCWTQKPCETFLSGDRKQVVDLPDCLCDCDIYEFTPFYAPYDVGSFTFTMIEQTGIEEKSYPITSAVYSETDEVFKLRLPLPSCKCSPECGCKTKYKLIVEYVAGYDLIPYCLLPIFCEALQYVHDRRECDCEKCQTCGDQYEETRQEVFKYNLTDQLKLHFMQVLADQYKRQLSLISLCDKQNELWGFVV